MEVGAKDLDLEMRTESRFLVGQWRLLVRKEDGRMHFLADPSGFPCIQQSSELEVRSLWYTDGN